MEEDEQSSKHPKKTEDKICWRWRRKKNLKKGDAEKQEVQSKRKRIWKRRNEEAESEEAAEKEEAEEKMRTWRKI